MESVHFVGVEGQLQGPVHILVTLLVIAGCLGKIKHTNLKVHAGIASPCEDCLVLVVVSDEGADVVALGNLGGPQPLVGLDVVDLVKSLLVASEEVHMVVLVHGDDSGSHELLGHLCDGRGGNKFLVIVKLDAVSFLEEGLVGEGPRKIGSCVDHDEILEVDLTEAEFVGGDASLTVTNLQERLRGDVSGGGPLDEAELRADVLGDHDAGGHLNGFHDGGSRRVHSLVENLHLDLFKGLHHAQHGGHASL